MAQERSMTLISCFHLQCICQHRNTVICHAEGDTVCLDCSKVVESSLTSCEIYPTHEYSNLNDKVSLAYGEYLDVTDACSRLHIEDSNTIYKIYEKYLDIKRQKIFKKEEMISFAIYQFMKSEKTPRSIKEISRTSFIPTKKIWKIEKSQGVKLASSTPKQLLETYYKHFLSYKDKTSISELIDGFKDSGTSFSPASICAGLCYFYCKQRRMSTSMKKIANIFHISVMSIHRFFKYYKRTHCNL